MILAGIAVRPGRMHGTDQDDAAMGSAIQVTAGHAKGVELREAWEWNNHDLFSKNNKNLGGWPGQTSLVLRLLRAVERAQPSVIRPELLKVGLRSKSADLRALLRPPRGRHNGFLPPVAAGEARSSKTHRR